MLKKLLSVLLVLSMAFSLGACGKSENTVSDIKENISNTVAQMLSGNVQGKVGKNYSTQWFEFRIDYIEEVAEYAGYKPAEGNRLLDVLIMEKCTFDEPIPMGTFDFYLDAAALDEEIFPMDPLDQTMMPEDFDLAAGESVSYHMIYEVPKNTTDLLLSYSEVDEDENIGTLFTIKVN